MFNPLLISHFFFFGIGCYMRNSHQKINVCIYSIPLLAPHWGLVHSGCHQPEFHTHVVWVVCIIFIQAAVLNGPADNWLSNLLNVRAPFLFDGEFKCRTIQSNLNQNNVPQWMADWPLMVKGISDVNFGWIYHTCMITLRRYQCAVNLQI